MDYGARGVTWWNTHLRLRKGRVIDFIVSVQAIANEVDEYAFAKFLSEFSSGLECVPAHTTVLD
jgi:hypothetical protein